MIHRDVSPSNIMMSYEGAVPSSSTSASPSAARRGARGDGERHHEGQGTPTWRPSRPRATTSTTASTPSSCGIATPRGSHRSPPSSRARADVLTIEQRCGAAATMPPPSQQNPMVPPELDRDHLARARAATAISAFWRRPPTWPTRSTTSCTRRASSRRTSRSCWHLISPRSMAAPRRALSVNATSQGTNLRASAAPRSASDPAHDAHEDRLGSPRQG